MTRPQSSSPAADGGEAPSILTFAPSAFVLMWSTGFIAAKYAAPVAGPFSLLALRFVLVVPILAAAAFALGRRWPRGRALRDALVAGALIHGLYLGGVFFAVKQGMPAGMTALIVGLQPLMTALFARLLLGERLRRVQVAGFAAGLVGVALVVAPKLGAASGVTPGGVALMVAAVASIAYGTVYSKRTAGAVDLVTGTALQFVGASLVLLPMAAAEGFVFVPSLQLAAVVAWLVLVLSIGAVMLLLTMVRHGTVTAVSALFYLVPPTTALMAYVLFGETLEPVQILGAAVVVASVFVATRPARPAG